MPKNAIDLFSGAGGLSLGLKQAKWSVSTAVEFDPNAAASHELNFDKTTQLCTDVRNIDFRQFKGIDMIAGGPPCQPFSVSGKRLGSEDARDMVPEFIRAVREAEPKVFMMENVAGLAGAQFSDYLQERIEEIQALGYCVFSKVLNAADFGVAQNRQRLFLVGLRTSAKLGAFSFPEPTFGPNRLWPYETVKKVLKNVPDDTPNNAKVVFCKNPVLRASPFAGMMFNGKGRPINLDGLSHTIPASAGGNRTHIVDTLGITKKYHAELLAGKKPRVGEMEGVRRLTVRESARVQSFPDDFIFSGKQSTRYSQVGNAVPPKLAAAVAESVSAVFQ
jgi:DNA (cytosine-5)-methyltransferase 1